MARMSWTKEDLVKLEALYDQRLPLCDIAQRLGRTKTAVNKALSRKSIRPAKESDPEDQYPMIAYKNSWVRMNIVILFLKSCGYIIKPNKGSLALSLGYLLDDFPTSALRLLMLANRIRVEDKKPIFRVVGLTEM